MEHFASRGLGTGEPPQRNLRRAEAQATAIDNGCAVSVGSPPPPSSFLAATACEIESAVKSLAALNERLRALADRVFGSPPETPGSPGGPMPTGGCAAGDIEQRVNAVHTLVQQAHFTVARLESL